MVRAQDYKVNGTPRRYQPLIAPDEVWLSHCGKHSYLALTRDQRIRYRPLEKQALIEHGVACFTFTQGQAMATQSATRIVELALRMVAIAASQPRPFVYTFGLSGGASKDDIARWSRLEVGDAQAAVRAPPAVRPALRGACYALNAWRIQST
jgi:hypothetical protein